jgi:PLP dependent protein
MKALAENLERLEEAIAAACRKAGRPRSEVELMAVSKTYPASTVIEAASLGLHLFGENRVQEFASKAPDLVPLRQSAHVDMNRPSQIHGQSHEVSGHDFSRAESPSKFKGALAPEASSAAIRVHLIGHLQSNKATRAVELFDAIDAIDSLRLAERLNEAAAKLNKRLPILIEVKLSPEESKAGLDPNSPESAALLERLHDLSHLDTRGLMTIAPWGVTEDITRACFRSLRTVRDQWSAAHPRLPLDVLSMGMSGDFPLAIEEGATRIRVGTALFGKRQPWTGEE